MISVVIRTYNEAKHLEELLKAIQSQQPVFQDQSAQDKVLPIEIVLVDSGSTDRTLEIAKRNGVRITYIDKSQFTFGRSLNRGCEAASGDILVFVSGHCIPASNQWLSNLVSPLLRGACDYTYGRQIGKGRTKFSESRLFEKYFPQHSNIPQSGWFCNNANAAITRVTWQRHQFDESLTGLEDLFLGQQLLASDGRIGYVADATVYHLHDESWRQIRIRYERESFAMQRILPEVHFGLRDLVRCVLSGIFGDLGASFKLGLLSKVWLSVIFFRWNQYYGVYRGNHKHRMLSNKMKMRYYYPTVTAGEAIYDEKKNHRISPAESK